MTYTNAVVTRRDWMQQAGVVLSGGSWSTSLPLTNILIARPQLVAQAASNASANTTFSVDLGQVRQIGLIHCQNLVTTTAGTIRIRAGTDATFATNLYDSTALTSWPLDTSVWGDGATLYQSDEYAALGRPRFFLPPAIIGARYVRLDVVDTSAVPPLQIGYFGVCEAWPFTNNMDFGWSITTLDESDVERVPFGSTYVTIRGKRRRINATFSWVDQSTDFLERVLGIGLIKGKSDPLVLMPVPGDTNNLEKTSVWGTFTDDPIFTNTAFATSGGIFSAQLQLEQLI